MNLAAKKLNFIATNPWFVVAGGISSIIAFIWFLYDKTLTEPSIAYTVYLIVVVLIVTTGYVYSIKVRFENIALRHIAETFSNINNIYKYTLQKMFGGSSANADPINLMTEEERALRSVCQRIENVFSRVINRDCLVTIKLVTSSNNTNYADTYIRSLDNCERDRPNMEKYKIDAESNSAFFKAIQQRSDGKPPHFYSGDLEKEKDYCNERQHYSRYYKSAIVVPIMGSAGVNSGDKQDLIGFLSVDTLSTNRLNNNYHLHMLSSLASQIYNFMSLMRGKYTVFVGA